METAQATAGQKTFKSALLEFYQEKGVAPKNIKFTVEACGSVNAPEYSCRLLLPGLATFKAQLEAGLQELQGFGRSKKAAEHNAASRALDLLLEARLLAPPGAARSQCNKQHLGRPTEPDLSSSYLPGLIDSSQSACEGRSVPQRPSSPDNMPDGSETTQKESEAPPLEEHESSAASGTTRRWDLFDLKQPGAAGGNSMAAMSCMIDSLTAEEARARLKDATLQIQDLQAKLVQLKGHKEIDLARLKFAAQALLGQGQGQSHFQQALESMEREKLS